MKRYSSDWERELASSPFDGNLFTDKQYKNVERRIRQHQGKGRELARSKRHGSVILIPIVAIAAVAALLLLFQPDRLGSLLKEVNSWFSVESPRQEPPVPPEQTEQDPVQEDQENKGEWVRFKGSTYAFEDPNYWSGGYYAFIVNSETEYKLLENNGAFVKVQDGEQTGWIPSWYLLDEEQEELVQDVKPYVMIIGKATDFYAYPDQAAPSGFVLDEGKVVQILRQYGDWFSVDIPLYAEPITGEKWIHRDNLIVYDDMDAREGYLRLKDGGSFIYGDKEAKEQRQHIDYKMTVRIDEAYEDTYRITAAGGMMGYVKKDDFIPNPYELTRGTYMELTSAEQEALDRFAHSRDDEDLRGLEPISVFKIYQQASLMGDAGLLYDLLYMQEGIPSRDQFIEEYNRTADLSVNGEMLFITIASQTELKTEYSGDEAYIQPLQKEDGEWHFRLLRDAERDIWKVSWLARQ